MKTFTKAQGDKIISNMQVLVNTYTTYHAAKDSFKAALTSLKITRTPECIEFLHNALAVVFDAKDFEISSSGMAIKFHKECAAKAFWYREVMFVLPRIGRGKADAAQIVVTPLVKTMLAEWKKATSAERAAFNKLKATK
jgi:hypothetical protein